METSGWILIAGIFWFFGYIKTKFGLPSDGKLVLIPKWLYIIVCGLPQSNDLPKDTVLAIGLKAQIIGWLLAAYGLFFKNLINDDLLTFLVGFMGSLLLSNVLANLVDRS